VHFVKKTGTIGFLVAKSNILLKMIEKNTGCAENKSQSPNGKFVYIIRILDANTTLNSIHCLTFYKRI
jgi:hypothetical protein